MGLGERSEALGRASARPKSVQEASKRPKRRPRDVQVGPRGVQVGPRGVQEASKSGQEASKSSQVRPKRRPRRSKSCPRRSKRRPRDSKLGSRDVQEASKSHKTAVQAQFDSKQRHLVKTMVFSRKIKVFAGQERSRKPVWRAKWSPSGAWRPV